MGAISVTVADVRPLPGSIVRRFDAGGTLTPGQAVYIADDGDVEAADADAEASSQARGIVVADSAGGVSFSSGDKVDVVVLGPVAGFASMSEGEPIYVSTAAGSIDQTAPATSGDYPFVVGYAESTAIVFVMPQAQAPTVNG